MTNLTNTQKLTRTALLTALICVVAPYTIPVGPIPITLGTFAIYLSAGVLGKKFGTIAVSIYILLGAVGVPVFSGFGAGLPKILSMTGGYIIGYIPLAFITGLFAERRLGFINTIVGMILGTIILYIFGTIWYCALTGVDLISAAIVCAVPFLPGDAIKIAAVGAIVHARVVANFVSLHQR